ncbi:MAG: ABC transporter ATP-binding protein [Arthrobacter sp.]|jgi:ABC-2 type transport system ATP-binding protein|nr:ABC transporter ATP-binding protein [Arthrobacter sp.]
MNTSTAPAVELTDLVKTFKRGTVRAVNGVDLTIRRGEIVAFLGPNGAGKTTTIDMALGLTTPTSGTATVFGDNPRKAAASGRLSAVLQTGGLLHDVTVQEIVNVTANFHSLPRARVAQVMEAADLTELARRKVGKCSGGEQQRVKFAMAILSDPDVLVLDEPTAGMDVNARRRFWDVMRAEADAGRTILFATHYLEEAEQFARRTVVMSHGEVVADAPTQELRASLGGRVLHASLPAGAPDQAWAALQSLPGVVEPFRDGNRVSVRSTDSDATALTLLTTLACTDLEIVAPTLETAFAALTQD